MELRKCECGDKQLLMNFTCAQTGKYRVLCVGEDCWRMTPLKETEIEAIQEWNEGKVE